MSSLSVTEIASLQPGEKMLQRTRFFLHSTAVCLAVAAISACGGEPTAANAHEPFVGEPLFSGVVTKIASGGHNITALKDHPTGECDRGDFKIVVFPDSTARRTDVRWESGASASASDVEVGFRIEVWGGMGGLLYCGGGDVYASGVRLLRTSTP